MLCLWEAACTLHCEQSEKGIGLRSCCQTEPEQGGRFTHLLSGVEVWGVSKLGLVEGIISLGMIARQGGMELLVDTRSRQGSALSADLVLHRNSDESGGVPCTRRSVTTFWKQAPDWRFFSFWGFFLSFGVLFEFFFVIFFWFLIVPIICTASLKAEPWAEQTQRCSRAPWKEPAAPQLIIIHGRAGLCSCCGYTFTHPGLPRLRSTSTACETQSSWLIIPSLPYQLPGKLCYQSGTGTLLTDWHSIILSIGLILHNPAKEFCSLSSSTSGFAKLCKHKLPEQKSKNTPWQGKIRFKYI